jgi:hypothetical protein
VSDKNTRSFLLSFKTTYTKSILYTFSPTLELNTYFDVYNSKLAFGLCSPDIGSDYLPSLSVPNFVLTLVQRSCARHATAAFPATILISLDLT